MHVTALLLFNPFRGSILQAFLAHLHASLLSNPSRLRLVVANPTHFHQAAASTPRLLQTGELSVFHPRMEHMNGYRLQVHFYEAHPTAR